MMKKMVLILGLGVLILSGCGRETILPVLITDADLIYDFYSDRYGTVVEGEVYNDGETSIDAVQLEIRLYDDYGFIVDYEYVWVDTYFSPGHPVTFYFELSEPWIYDVAVYINAFD